MDQRHSSAHLGFITLAPQYKSTRTGYETFKGLCKRICEVMEKNNIQRLTFSTHSKNVPINRLLKRLNPEKLRKIGFETEYQVSIDKLKSVCG